MMKKHVLFLAILTIFTMPLIVFATNLEAEHAALAKDYIQKIEAQDEAYIVKKGSTFFKSLAKGQRPWATVVTCSDSRVQNSILDKAPEGHLFMVSNIGNQITTELGSVEYGINHLGSSLLLIIGHSRCGAIEAVSNNNYIHLEPGIIKELHTIQIHSGVNNIEGVKTNVNNQVTMALKEFHTKVQSKQLMVVGAVYDFANDMKLGAGKLNIININGETNVTKLHEMMITKMRKESD